MTPADERLRAALFARMTPQEIRTSVIYLATAPVAGGTTLAFGRVQVPVPWNARLAFVDLDPAANWTHPCRYVCIQPETGDIHSSDADRPPFGRRQPEQPALEWRVLYRAPEVPAALLAVPEEPAAG